MASNDDAIVELAEAETPVQAASAFMTCLRSDGTLAQAMVYALDEEPARLRLLTSTEDVVTARQDDAIFQCPTVCESIESNEERHVCVGELKPTSPLHEVFDLDKVKPDAVVRFIPVRGRKRRGRTVALLVLLCHHPPDSLSGPTTASMSTLVRLLAVALERVESASRNKMDMVTMRESVQSEMLLWNDLYHLFAYRHDSMLLTVELCRVMEKLVSGSSSVFLVNEVSGNLLCQVRDLKFPKEDIVLQIASSPYGVAVEANSICIIDNLEGYPNDVLLLDRSGNRPTAMMCAAITARFEDGAKEKVSVMALSSYNFERFTEKDLAVFRWLIEHATPLYLGVLLNDSLTLSKLQNETLLQVAGHLFTHLDDMSRLLKEILSHARKLIGAERCSLFLLETNSVNEDELVAVIFDNEIVGEKARRIALTHSIAGHVAMTGELCNVTDTSTNIFFSKDVDLATGFETKNMLCFPIKGKNGSVLGVAQLLNKVGGSNFSYIDEELAKSFAVYCGISICHSLLYMRAKDAQNRSRLATELMIYHMQNLNEEDVKTLAQLPTKLPDSVRSQMHSFRFSHKAFEDMETMQLLVSMFDEMGLIQRWRIPKEALCRFILTVKRGYRHPPYHNWDHAFSVAHFCYCLWKRCDHLSYLSDLQVLGLFVASLCHDIDHRGTNNAFQVNAHSVLAALYSSEGSVMEHHHFAQTMCILNTENCNIFVNMSAHEYQAVLDIMYEVILDTDIAVHLKKVKDMGKMAEDGVDANNSAHHHLLLSLLMTSCDLNSSTKPWLDAQEAAQKIYMEFFSQGDMERSLDLQSQEMMDRNRACIPEQQISFTDFIAMPVFKILHKVYPQTSNVVGRLRYNHATWKKVKQLYWDQNSSVGSTMSSKSGSITRSESVCNSCSEPPEDVVTPTFVVQDATSPTAVSEHSRHVSASSVASYASNASRASLDSTGIQSQMCCVSVGSTGSKSSTGSYPRSDSAQELSEPEQKSQQRQRASTGQMPDKRMRLNVYDTYLSRRASHLVGADYTLQAADLQAVGSAAPPDVQPSNRRIGQVQAPVVDRVADHVRGKIRDQISQLTRGSDGSRNPLASVEHTTLPMSVERSRLQDVDIGILSELPAVPDSVIGDFCDPSPLPIAPSDFRLGSTAPRASPFTPIRFDRDQLGNHPNPLRPLRYSADDAKDMAMGSRRASNAAAATTATTATDGGGKLVRTMSGTALPTRRRTGAYKYAPGDGIVAKRRRSQVAPSMSLDTGF